MNIREINHREQLPDFLNRHGLVGEGAVIGVYHGDYEEHLLTHWQGQKLNLIDPYKDFPDEVYRDGCKINHPDHTPVDWEAMFWKTHGRLNKFPASYFIRQTSTEAVKLFQDGQLDFVYLDGNHDLPAISEDIRLWWPKVKSGGVLAGHDLYHREDYSQRCGVLEAVLGFSARERSAVHATFCTSWWFLKT